ncbi:MAG TPA: SprT family zinc-dependent metalloprotease [Ignavibacteriaceae bacterium]|nr:SprT family zinc-dependent metalloprotease [Ignavibacteriaceae bacterium]
MKRIYKIDNLEVQYKLRVSKKYYKIEMKKKGELLEIRLPVSFPVSNIEKILNEQKEWIKKTWLDNPAIVIKNDKVKIKDYLIPFRVRVNFRAKYLRMKFHSNGTLLITIPSPKLQNRVQGFVESHSIWILEKYEKILQLKNVYALFGKELLIDRQYELFINTHKINFVKDRLRIISPEGSTISTDEVYSIWLKHYAKKYLPARTTELAKKYDFNPNRITVRGQSSRWGSCSRKGNISLNFNLLKFEKEMIDYVIIHELCHLRHLNHSPKFWYEVEKILPSYKSIIKKFKVIQVG